ncbi:hypothetical protein HZC07_05270 [Candidatus Micrarchaeota archaeon]|nr:hypothetical protein [Candidatus Micrarchaeota archaeon]
MEKIIYYSIEDVMVMADTDGPTRFKRPEIPKIETPAKKEIETALATPRRVLPKEVRNAQTLIGRQMYEQAALFANAIKGEEFGKKKLWDGMELRQMLA